MYDRKRQIEALRKKEIKYCKKNVNNTFYQRRNRARRADTATPKFEQEMRAAFDLRIADEIHTINTICDQLLDNYEAIPQEILPRQKKGHITPLSQKIPVVSNTLTKKRPREEDPVDDGFEVVKIPKRDDSSSPSDLDDESFLSILDTDPDNASVQGSTGDVSDLLDVLEGPNVIQQYTVPQPPQPHPSVISAAQYEPTQQVEIESLPDHFFDHLSQD